MQTTTYKLNVTPGGVPLTIHISQYDVGLRQYTFEPYTNVGEFSYVSGATVTLEATKPDGYAVIHSCVYNQDGTITYTIQEQLAAKPGRVWSKVVIRDGADVLGTGAVLWIVDYAGVKDGAIISDSDISGLEGYVDQMKTLVGTPIAVTTAAGMTDHEKLYLYEGSESGYTAGDWYYWNGSAWTSGGEYGSGAVEIDPTLSIAGEAADAKATGDEITELKNDIQFDLKTIKNMAVASFDDGADDVPIKELTVNVDPAQDLHGYGYPWAAGEGKNLALLTFGNTVPSTGSGQMVSSNGFSSDFIAVDNTKNYVASISDLYNRYILFYDSSKTYLGYVSAWSGSGYLLNGYTNWGDTGYVKIRVDATQDKTFRMQLEEGSTATAYAPYENICPFTAITETSVCVTGINVWDEEWELGMYDSNTSTVTKLTDSTHIRSKNPIKVNGNSNYYMQSAGSNVHMIAADRNGNVLYRSTTLNNIMFTTPVGTEYLYFNMAAAYGTTYSNNISINSDAAETSYFAYTGQTYTQEFPSGSAPVYGGSMDVISGTLNVAPYYASYNGETLTGHWYSDRDVYTPNGIPTIGASVVNDGGTPTVYHASLMSLNTHPVVTNIYSSTGDVAKLVYRTPNNTKTDALNYKTTVITQSLTVGLPVLYLYGDTHAMTKENSVELEYRYDEISGTCDVKWQGSSSLAYSKKNYTVKFDTNIDVGWGNQKKYCFKANYIDNTSALNICGANLWSQIVANRGGNPAISLAANNGAMDGFPVIIMLNDEFHGLYTWNTPKDKWVFGMGDSNVQYIVTAENHTQPTQFRAAAALDGVDFDLEYADDSVDTNTVKTALNNMLNVVKDLNSSGWENSISGLLDYGNVIDYYIFSALLANTDGIDKNFILTTYDGAKWYFNAYDLDSILGNDWTGVRYYTPKNTCNLSEIAVTSHLFDLVYKYNKGDLVSRYNTLRNGILSDENLYMTFYNFCARIPKDIVDMDNKKWYLKPGTYTETLSRIMEWYRMRLAFIDTEVQALS